VVVATETLTSPILERLERNGIDRRKFLKYCAGLTSLLCLPDVYTPRVARALQETTKPGLIWLEFQDCAGNTESFLRSRNPGVADIVLDVLSVNYHETIMAAPGAAAEAAREAAIEEGGYLVVVEGSIPLADGGVYCTIGGKTARQILDETVANSGGVISIGTCSSYGGIPAASPNPTGAVGVRELVGDVPVLNLPGCPANADNITATVVHYLTFGALPAADSEGRPLFAYGERIHDHCERRAHFDAGQFALEWGDEGHRKGWCLYKLGCKGPATYHNCPSVRWNGGTSWPIGAGHGCVGCSEPFFWDTMTPFYRRLGPPPGFGVETTADTIGIGVVAATAAGFAAHGVGKIVQRAASGELDRAPEPMTMEEADALESGEES
jgi:hydrogenase small subunit